jgi:RNA polymerase sigma factor (sigma-70 family)
MTGGRTALLLRHLRGLTGDRTGRLADHQLLERFATHRDEAAFTALVERHGPMVLRVCRRVLQDGHAAEDAFQATFLVLVRKAGSLRRRELVGNWLYGVAYRVAARARVEAAKRRDREGRTALPPPGDPLAEVTGRELTTALDDELNRLPDKYRAPLVLCYLQGLSRDEAAQQLGWSLGTFKRRLEQARDVLHRRLARRGLTLSVGLLATVLSGGEAAAMPAALVGATVRVALAGPGVVGGASGSVATLVEGVLKSMFLAKLRMAAILFLAAGVAVVGVGLLAHQAVLAKPSEARTEADPQPPAGEPRQPRADSVPEGSGTRRMTGTVVDAAGNAMAGVDVWLTTNGIYAQAEVFSRTRTDGQGRFQATIPGRWFAMVAGLRQELGLFAYKPGFRPAAFGFSRSAVPPEAGMRLVLEAPAASTLQVLAADGTPVAGGRVEVTALVGEEIHTDITEERARDLASQFKSEVRPTPVGFGVRRLLVNLPEELSRLLAVKTDAQGNATFREIPRADVGRLAVTAPAVGTQEIFRDTNPPRGSEFPPRITLGPVGRLAGRLVAKNAAALQGASILVGTLEGTLAPGQALYRTGRAVVEAGADGRFEVPALAVGNATLQVRFPRGATVRAGDPEPGKAVIQAGRRAEVSIPVGPAVRVQGSVRERGTGKPVAGAAVLVGYGNDNAIEEVVTDAQGRYEFLAPPGSVYVIPGLPRGYSPPTQRDPRQDLQGTVPEGARQHTLPAIELTPAIVVRGTVVDADGKPVAGAQVRAMGMAQSHQFGNFDLSDRIVSTNARGEFAFDEVSPATELRLTVKHQGAFLAQALTVKGEQKQPLALPISPAHAARLTGRLVDTAGKPVPNAELEVWHRPWMPPPNEGTPHKVAFDGKPALRSDAAGKFETPPLVPDGEYRIEVRAEGFQTERSPWQPAGGKPTLTVADVVLPRLQALGGSVRDRQGKPVPGARVLYVDNRSRATATTDAEGRFRLANPLVGSGYLFVEKAGYRFHGQPVGPRTDAWDVTLTRGDEPASRTLQTLPLPLEKKERRALAGRVLEPVLKKALAGKDDSLRTRSQEALARLDPARVLEQIEKKPDKNPWFDDYLRRAVAQGLAEESLDEARTVIDAMRDPSFRATGYIDLCDKLPAAKRTQQLELLGQSLLHARSIPDASHRVVHLGPIAPRLRELGEADRAEKLLREGQALAKELPTQAWAGYARGAFAEELALIDLPAALALIKDLKDPYEYDRHHGNIAHKLAGKNPAEAERVLKMLRHPNQPTLRDQWAQRVCYRMAPVDLERAKRIADRIGDPYHKAYAHGVMAQALAKSQPAVAKELLQKAFALLQAVVEAGKDQFNGFWGSPSVGGCLLPVAEQIDPQLVPQFFWRALSFRSPPPAEDDRAWQGEMGDAALAMVLARYDRAMARPLVEAAARRMEKLTGRMEAFFTAALLIDPAWAVKLVEDMPEGREKDWARLTVTGMLTRSGEEFWRKVHSHLALWAPDAEDW